MHNFNIIIQLFYSYVHIFCILKFYTVFFTDNFLIILSFCYFISFLNQGDNISFYKKEGIDKMAERNLKRCDSLCLTLNVKKHPALLSDFHTAVCTGAL